MKNAKIQLLLLSIILLSSCSMNQKIAGLWEIEKVKVGTEEMTPVARWTRLNKDNTQESGNGWRQHTVGKWAYDSKEKTINLLNENGLKDEFGGFQITEMGKQKMVWTRMEEGQSVAVYLNRIEKIPAAPFNKLLGVWRLKETTNNAAETYLFLRWDQIAISRTSSEDRKYGMYKTHGHKNELEIIYYEEPLRQEVWTYRFSASNDLILELKSKENKLQLEYERIDYIPK